jgi:hypothetical protein
MREIIAAMQRTWLVEHRCQAAICINCDLLDCTTPSEKP